MQKPLSPTGTIFRSFPAIVWIENSTSAVLSNELRMSFTLLGFDRMMRDTALLPVQLGGLYDLIDDLKIVQVPDAGHFVPWEKPAPVIRAIEEFMQRT